LAVLGSITFDWQRSSLFTVLAALHTSIFGGSYTTDNIYVATTDNTAKSIKTSFDDDNGGETTLIHEQNNTAEDIDENGSGKELPVSLPLIHKQNATTVGEPYVNRWQRRFSDSENR